MHGIIGASTDASDRTYRLAFGPNQGKKALTLQAVPSKENRMKVSELVSKQADFSLHAGVACKSNHLGGPSVRSLNVSAGISRGLLSERVNLIWTVIS
ncbi:MAG: hypothetical protein ACFHX7_11560 [Pseudomonadota bacterium]